MRVLVTGGAGYIGGHVVRLLRQRGDDVVVIDDFSTGRHERLGATSYEPMDLSVDEAPANLRRCMDKHKVEAIIHLAARKQVAESIAKPAQYYRSNISGLANLLVAMEDAGVTQLVYSSSAAAYGMPDVDAVTEETPAQPINPYGETKLVGEWLNRAASGSWGLRSVNLRYFNVAGSGWDALGDQACLNLIPMVFERLAQGQAPRVFGDDYRTPDGTCVRDFVHVMDVAEAHLAALWYLERQDRPFDTFNVGTGRGASVLQVLDEVSRVTGHDRGRTIVPRRAGDPPRLVADVSRIETTLGWRAERNLNDIVQSAWAAWQLRALA